MIETDLTTTTIGGIVALLVLREVFGFLKVAIGRRRRSADDSSAAGDRSVEFWRSEVRSAVEGVLEPIMAQQTGILSKLEAVEARQTEILIGIEFRVGELKEGQVRMRSSLHDLRERIQHRPRGLDPRGDT